MDNNNLIDHVKRLILDCRKDEYDKIMKYLEVLNKLSKYKYMEEKKEKYKKNENGGTQEDDPILKINGLNNVLRGRIIIVLFFICSVILFWNFKEELKTQMGIVQVECNTMQQNPNLGENKTVKFTEEECSTTQQNSNIDNIYLLITIYFVAFIIFAFCVLFVYKCEYNAWIKDKELSNDLKKSYYQWRINKMMKDRELE